MAAAVAAVGEDLAVSRVQRTVAVYSCCHRASAFRKSTSRIPGTALRSSDASSSPGSLMRQLQEPAATGRILVDRAGRRFELGVDLDDFAGDRRVDFARGLHALDDGGLGALRQRLADARAAPRNTTSPSCACA